MDQAAPEARDERDGSAKHMATQACEMCRQRKVKCDEERPRCGVCQRVNVICEYREVKPTKKDKTLTFILDSLKALEVKVDLIYSQKESNLTSLMANQASTASQLHVKPSLSGSERSSATLGSVATGSVSPTEQVRSVFVVNSTLSRAPRQEPSTIVHHHQIEARKLLAWPVVRSFLQDDLVQTLEYAGPTDGGGEMWLTRISQEFQAPLSTDELTNLNFHEGNSASSWDSQGPQHTRGVIENLCLAFFRWFHPVYPILDRFHFYNVTLPQAFSSSFAHNDACSTLVLVVLALGTVAQEGISANPIVDPLTGRRTGIRGGTVDRTPGLAFLNEAQRRHGFLISQYNLATIQSSILIAVYYAQCSRNLEYWRMTSLSCSLCQNMVRTTVNWRLFESDLLARSYWMCIHLEGGLTTELGMTPTGLADLESSVPLPLFISSIPIEDPGREDNLFIEYHFLAQNTLRALLNRIYTSLRFYDNPFQRERSNDIIPRTLIIELARQLQAWREHLPALLQWSDDNPDDGIAMSSMPATWQLTVLQEQVSPTLQDVRVILTASLRTRYQYAQYLIWRPYIYKALHFPDSGVEDLDGCRKALKACLYWPLTYPVFQECRRLIPHIYEYSHTFFGILVLLYVCNSSPILQDILEHYEMHNELERSKGYMLCWMRDMQIAHPVARWCWRLLEVIYKDHDLLGDGEGSRRSRTEEEGFRG